MARNKKKGVPNNGGPAGFEAFYSGVYGQRWPTLKEALLGKIFYYELSSGLEKSYFLDEASFVAARFLGIRPGMRVLDLCAAPGGKALVLLSQLLERGSPGTIDYTANERSGQRRARLRGVLQEHLPSGAYQAVSIAGHDAGKWGLYEQNAYDRILLDVPCSSERHLLHKPKHLMTWSPGRSKRLAQQAYAFLLAAITALRPGGFLLYSTCSLSPLENDKVIERAMDRIGKKGSAPIRPDNAEYHSDLPPRIEQTERGYIILPDRADGRGPIYFSRIQKQMSTGG